MSCDYLGRTVEDKILDDKDNKDDKKLNQVKGLVNRGKKLVAPMRGKRYIVSLAGLGVNHRRRFGTCSQTWWESRVN